MTTTDPRVDAYIASAQPFARPILNHLRDLVHKACPDVKETIKWSFPHFLHENVILCAIAGFKKHCWFLMWHPELRKAGGKFDRITCPHDLPTDRELLALIKKGLALAASGPIKRPRTPKPPPRTPRDLLEALKKAPKALTTFNALPPSHRREYIVWINDCKHPETRERRIATTVQKCTARRGL